jgi:outer membrane murein-binding lipoprotein Lpp
MEGEMVFKRRAGMLLSGTILASIFVAAPALAQDAQTDQMQRQINALQKQLQTLQSQVTETKQQAKAAQESAQTAQQSVQSIPPGLYNADLPTKAAAAPSWFGGIHVSLAGSYIAMEGVWRQHNEISSGASDPPFGTLPFHNSPLYFENENRYSAQQSRLAIKASGDIDPAQHLTAYWENDWLGAGVTANSRESNSYNLRMRQAWLFYDNDNWHSHFLAGQAWSMVTANKLGILPGTENAPLTIDAQYAVGFNWARQPQLRFVQDWNKTLWFGVSVESSQTAFASNGTPLAFSAANGAIVPTGLGVDAGNACNAAGLLNNTTTCSNNIFPDVVEKVALDPGWGHYEAVGIQRWFTDSVALNAPPFLPKGATSPGWQEKTNFGWGVGGSVLLPVIPTFLDLQGSVLTGEGLGRYGSSQLADVTIGPDGTLKPLHTTQVLLGFVAHPWVGLDLYGYAGQEQVSSNFWTQPSGKGFVGAGAGGYGNPAYLNGGCFNENTGTTGSAGFNTPIAGTSCTANVQRTQELTFGFWQQLYKGDLGQVRVGAQYEYVRLKAFPGATTGAGSGPTPNQGLNPNNNIVFFSLRYYPFN